MTGTCQWFFQTKSHTKTNFHAITQPQKQVCNRYGHQPFTNFWEGCRHCFYIHLKMKNKCIRVNVQPIITVCLQELLSNGSRMRIACSVYYPIRPWCNWSWTRYHSLRPDPGPDDNGQEPRWRSCYHLGIHHSPSVSLRLGVGASPTGREHACFPNRAPCNEVFQLLSAYLRDRR